MTYRSLILFFAILFGLTCFWGCQEKTADSSPPNTPESTIDSLVRQAIEARNLAPHSIITLSDSIIKLSQEAAYLEGEFRGLYNKAIGYYFQTRDRESQDLCYTILEKTAESPMLDSVFLHNINGSVYTLLGVLKKRQGNYLEAIPLHIKGLEEFEKIDNWDNIADAYANIADDFKLVKDFEKAIFYNEKAEEFYLKAENSNQLLSVYQNRGSIYYDQGNYHEALAIFESTLEKARINNDIENIIHATNNIGASYEELGQSEIALQNYITALEMYRERKDPWGEANALGNISMVNFGLTERLEQAEEYALAGLSIAQEYQFLELEKFNYENLHRIYEKKGNFQESLKMLKQAQVLQDSLYNQQKFETLSTLEQQYDKERTKLIIVQKDKAIVESQLKSQRLQSLITLLGIIFLALLSGAWLLYQQAKFRKVKNQELLQKNTIIQHQNEDLKSLIDAYEAQREKFIQIGPHEIPLDDIVYIRYQSRMTSIFLKDESVIEYRTQLSQLLAELNFKSHFVFSQINQNYIVHFKNVEIDFFEGEEEKYYFVSYLPNDHWEGRNEDYIKTRKRSGLNKNFEREYHRYLRLQRLKYSRP
jgi:tetratricopeptide (TPR) repeat protein